MKINDLAIRLLAQFTTEEIQAMPIVYRARLLSE